MTSTRCGWVSCLITAGVLLGSARLADAEETPLPDLQAESPSEAGAEAAGLPPATSPEPSPRAVPRAAPGAGP